MDKFTDKDYDYIADQYPDYEILLASRSYSNESLGKGMYGCLACNGVVVAYFPNEIALNHYLDNIHKKEV